MRALEIKAGMRFGKLRVERFHESTKDGRYWLCCCDCGTTTIRRTQELTRKGRNPSCGCTHGHAAFFRKTHGQTGTPLYRVWRGMISRCTWPKAESWKYYGGKGITVCERWKSFETFAADMGPRPAGLTLERRDSNLGYSPDNCYWATRMEQQNNISRNRFVEWDGKRLSIAQWARVLGLDWRTFERRLGAGRPMSEVFSPERWKKRKRTEIGAIEERASELRAQQTIRRVTEEVA